MHFRCLCAIYRAETSLGTQTKNTMLGSSFLEVSVSASTSSSLDFPEDPIPVTLLGKTGAWGQGSKPSLSLPSLH